MTDIVADLVQALASTLDVDGGDSDQHGVPQLWLRHVAEGFVGVVEVGENSTRSVEVHSPSPSRIVLDLTARAREQKKAFWRPFDGERTLRVVAGINHGIDGAFDRDIETISWCSELVFGRPAFVPERLECSEQGDSGLAFMTEDDRRSVALWVAGNSESFDLVVSGAGYADALAMFKAKIRGLYETRRQEVLAMIRKADDVLGGEPRR